MIDKHGRLRWRLGTACLLLLAAAMPAPGAGSRLLFVANLGDDTVSVVDRDLDREVKVIPVGKSPQAVAVRAEPPLVAVANARARHATLIDPLTLEALPDGAPTGMGPEDVAFTPDGRLLVATSYYDRTVTFTDLASRSLVGEPLTFPGIPRRLRVSPDGARLFVLLHAEEGAMAVVDLASRRAERVVPAGKFPADLAVTPDGARVFVASFDDQAVRVIDARTGETTSQLKLAVGSAILMNPSRPLLYSLLSFDGAVLAFDLAAGQPAATIAVGGSPSAGVCDADGFLWVANEEGDHVVKVDTRTNSVLVRIAVGSEPQGLAVFERAAGLWRRALLAAGVAAALVAGLAVALRRRRRTA